MNRLARILVVIPLLGVRTAAALDPERQLSEFAHRLWGGNYGIPTGVMALAQTKDGYLWIASERASTGLMESGRSPSSLTRDPSYPRPASEACSPPGMVGCGWAGAEASAFFRGDVHQLRRFRGVASRMGVGAGRGSERQDLGCFRGRAPLPRRRSVAHRRQ
jgi:hypothetical protein